MTALHHQEPLFSANSVFKSHSLETLPLLGDSACHKFVLKFFSFQPGDSVLEMSPSGAEMLKERVLLYLQASARSLKQCFTQWITIGDDLKKNSEWLIYLKLHLMGFCASVQGFQHFVIFWSDCLKKHPAWHPVRAPTSPLFPGNNAAWIQISCKRRDLHLHMVVILWRGP